MAIGYTLEDNLRTKKCGCGCSGGGKCGCSGKSKSAPTNQNIIVVPTGNRYTDSSNYQPTPVVPYVRPDSKEYNVVYNNNERPSVPPMLPAPQNQTPPLPNGEQYSYMAPTTRNEAPPVFPQKENVTEWKIYVNEELSPEFV